MIFYDKFEQKSEWFYIKDGYILDFYEMRKE